jgi:putative restriction endonuclease
MAKAARIPWKREDVVKALSLYCVLPFGRFHTKNPDVIELARDLGRSPGSVSLKLCNFASFDDHHKARGVAGMGNASKLDREVWDEFYGKWERLADAIPDSRNVAEETLPELKMPSGPTSTERLLKVRRGQRFFRKAVLSAYEDRCWITGIANPDLLRASHILPWSSCEEHRLNPRNGVCLNALHDAAFDEGLLCFDEGLRVRFSPRLARSMPKEAYEAHFGRYLNRAIRPPDRFAPDPEFLRAHRNRCQGV